MEILQHVFEQGIGAASYPTAGTLGASAQPPAPAHVRPGAAFVKASNASVVPADFSLETFDALLRYSE